MRVMNLWATATATATVAAHKVAVAMLRCWACSNSLITFYTTILLPWRILSTHSFTHTMFTLINGFWARDIHIPTRSRNRNMNMNTNTTNTNTNTPHQSI